MASDGCRNSGGATSQQGRRHCLARTVTSANEDEANHNQDQATHISARPSLLATLIKAGRNAASLSSQHKRLEARARPRWTTTGTEDTSTTASDSCRNNGGGTLVSNNQSPLVLSSLIFSLPAGHADLKDDLGLRAQRHGDCDHDCHCKHVHDNDHYTTKMTTGTRRLGRRPPAPRNGDLDNTTTT
ncbi:hypothetical protein BDZ89DRAFT_397142 [Hymenopellis radicata]|nr:hypothetical protein BDZ89DRAFT_397142 [Hymenopellis radicata]